ncbi:hypothetical protein [Actinoplanes sp. NPDC051494]|uniref:hypothetical protein n=1 Tax=Actinoplanes sp. NPDC051494 TaxID=3363907 RepID=UPI00379E5AD7
MTTDDLLRDTVRELAGEARPPSGLAAAAMARGRRLRRRRRTGMIAAAASLVLLTTVPYAILSRTQRQAPQPPAVTTTAPDWSTKVPYALPGGWAVTSVQTEKLTAVLNPATNSYRSVSRAFTSLSVSPDGRYVAVTDEAHDNRLGILTTATGKVRWTTAGHILEPIWSADSKRLLATGQDRFYLVEAASGKVIRRPVDYSCTNYCLLTWLPGDQEIAWAKPGVNGSETSEGTVWFLSVFDVQTGKWTRDLALPGTPASHDAWSPGGRYVLIRGDGTQAQRLRIADATTGTIRTQLTATIAYFVSVDRVLTVEDGVAALIDLDGRVLERVVLDPVLRNAQLGYGPAR